MFKVTIAQFPDMIIIIDMIKNMNEQELKYLRYNESHGEFVKRIGTNIINGCVIMFYSDETPIGFMEYEHTLDNTIWISSLYFMKEHRKHVFPELTPIFVQLKNKFKKDILFTVDPTNRAMKMLIHLIRAKEVRTYEDGRVEYVVKEED